MQQQQQKQSVGSTMKRKLADALPFGGMFGMERAAKITSPAQSREGTDHGSDTSSIHSSMHGSMHGNIDGTGHGYPGGVRSLDSTEHHNNEEQGMQSWGWGPMNPKADPNQTELLNQAAQSLEKFALRDGTLSPTGEAMASQGGDFKQIRGNLPPGSFQQGGPRPQQAGIRHHQMPPGARQMVGTNIVGRVSHDGALRFCLFGAPCMPNACSPPQAEEYNAAEEELGQRPEGICAPIPDIPAHRLNSIPTEQREAVIVCAACVNIAASEAYFPS